MPRDHGSGVGNARVLLALALDAGRWPANWSATGRWLNVSRTTVRTWAAELERQGLATCDPGWITPTEAGRAMLVAGCDALPRKLLGRVNALFAAGGGR